MNEEPDDQNGATSWENFYESILNLIGILIEIDPPKDSPEGRLLEDLAAAVEEYEKVTYPDLSQEPSGTEE